MSAAATMSQPPSIPPRPSRSTDKPNPGDSQPKIPPRPVKRFDRSISPNPSRFAPSPLNEPTFPKSPRASRFGANITAEDPIQRPGSVNLPSLGEEGHEYAGLHDQYVAKAASPPSSPEQTRLVAEDLKLHAPKPSVPAQTSKQRVQAVTRTDSDKAASYGIGRPSSEELPDRTSIRKKRSSMTGMSETDSVIIDDEEHGIPEIGQRVPMNPHLGDVQAPSPAPHNLGPDSGARSQTPRHHSRKHSARGFAELPPGSYGLHGHGTPQPTDKLEKAWYQKHPDSWKKESAVSLHDRQNDFAMSSTELNKIVRDTREAGLVAAATHAGTPSEEVGYQASDEYTQRISSRPGSTQPRSPELRRASPAVAGSAIQDDDEHVIHVDASHNRSRSFQTNPSVENLGHEDDYSAPILAEDEVAKDPGHWSLQPAVEPPTERRSSFLDGDRSRPTSRPGSIYNSNLASTPLEDVEEYEPLFPEEEERKKKAEAEGNTWKPRHKFPSKDIWEDAPDSVNATAVVSSPDLGEDLPRPKPVEDRPETPAQAFARLQEELAEKESRESENFARNGPAYLPLQQVRSHERPRAQNRFPSRDIWEDTPESLMHETTVNSEPGEEEEEEQEEDTSAQPQIPARPQKKASVDRPAIPERPKPRQSSSDDGSRSKPAVVDKPKPQIPARPTKTLPSGVDSKEQDALPRQKPAVPARPAGSKIQALQAGFMSDLNKRLQLGPQAPKKEEPPAADTIEEKEQKPLADARKGRARGPQRRAPAARSPAPVKELKSGAPVLSFSPLRTCWSIDDSGVLEIDNGDKPAPKEETKEVVPEVEAEPETAPQTAPEEKAEPTVAQPTAEPEPAEAAQLEKAPSIPLESEPRQEAPAEEVKTLASNLAGEPILEAKLDESKDVVEPVSVEATGGEKA
ncbi:altered inheritance of mitochondria protein 21 [Plectosphaerella cucumerina]|uniref:Altered inheritance of mitochondria protein 21 n=1 Tax=Plectosphaerella cucumerina TaxID=40658 RepID=A0A8K0TVV6_9PEZI|nr:altered inheritance of mitochondria protein 21 [Plectosphaerella cucumerina]